MIIVSVLYPNGPKARFDVDYYTRKHMPMVQQRLGTPLRRVVVEQGIAGGAPAPPPPFPPPAHRISGRSRPFQGPSVPPPARPRATPPTTTGPQPLTQTA